jgi:hypothetical protein
MLVSGFDNPSLYWNKQDKLFETEYLFFRPNIWPQIVSTMVISDPDRAKLYVFDQPDLDPYLQH